MTRLRNYLVAGIATVIPIWITWVVFRFILRQLSGFGMPWIEPLAGLVAPYAPRLEAVLLEPWFQQGAAVVLTLCLLLGLGWLASRVIGGRLITAFDRLMQRIPLVQTVYGATKALIGVLDHKPGQIQRVVLINFPSESMRTVGFVTRMLTDSESGRAIAAVYVPTTPNPTSGYLELLPWDELVTVDWTVDQAMTFVISGGTVSPDTVPYDATDRKVQPEDHAKDD